MAVIKVIASLFSSIKTVERGLEKMMPGDEIQLANGHYKESITIQQDVTITGNNRIETIFEGTIIIPKNCSVTLKNMTIIPTVQLYVEGMLTVEQVIFDGPKTSSILSLNGGNAYIENCLFQNAKDVAITALNESVIEIKQSKFFKNGKTHLMAESSIIRFSDSSFEDANHALWLKNKSKGLSGTNHFKKHTGTQIIVQNESTFTDASSKITDGQGNGVFAKENSTVTLNNTILKEHKLPQIWIQDSKLEGINCEILDGQESGIMLRSNSMADLSHCIISNHLITNIQVTMESRLNLIHSTIKLSEGIGLQLRDKSIANFEKTIFEKNKFSQLSLTEGSIASLKECSIMDGGQLGVYVENKGNCTIVACKINNHPNTAITVSDSEITVLDSEISKNDGNGILALNSSVLNLESSKFHSNNMPHIAGKTSCKLTANHCDFSDGKSIYMLDQSEVNLTYCKILDGTGVQVEVTDQTKLTMANCVIRKSTGNAVKASRNSTVHISDSQIAEHRLPQIVINDSSLIFRNSELIDGERNGFIIENHSEAHIQDSFISKHRYPQLWIDKNSTVELKMTQVTEGKESDIYVQNNSSVYGDQCIIRNDRFKFNVQAVNFSRIELTHSIVENSIGDEFYIENNSYITHKVD